MTEKEINSSNLSKKSQKKLEEIKQQQGFKTTEETIKYLTEFFKEK